jgi:DNA polymerase-1
MEEYKTKDKFVILDGHAIIYRAYHALKDLTDPTGKPINAVYGFARILLKVINDYDPKYIAVTFDHKNGKSARVSEYKEYKAQRPPMPDDLIDQVRIIKDLVRAFNIPQFEIDGFEADDLLGTIADEVKGIKNTPDGVQTIIVTGDKDILQLVDDEKTHVFIPGRGRFSKDKEYDEAGVKQKLGVSPDQIPDLKALMGDPSDNIPGVKGIGEKTAVKLIQEFGSIENLYTTVDALAKQESEGSRSQHQLVKGAVLTKLVADEQMAFLSKKLATIHHNAPIEFKLEKCVTKDYDKHKVAELFERYQFNSLKSLLPKDEFEVSVQDALF